MESLKKCVECGGANLRNGVSLETFEVAGVSFEIDHSTLACAACGESYVSHEAGVKSDLLVALHLARMGIRSGESFRFMRKSLGLSGKALAELLGVAAETLSRWEKGAMPVDGMAFVVLGGMVLDRLERATEPTLERLRALKEPRKTSEPVRLRVA